MVEPNDPQQFLVNYFTELLHEQDVAGTDDESCEENKQSDRIHIPSSANGDPFNSKEGNNEEPDKKEFNSQELDNKKRPAEVVDLSAENNPAKPDSVSVNDANTDTDAVNKMAKSVAVTPLNRAQRTLPPEPQASLEQGAESKQEVRLIQNQALLENYKKRKLQQLLDQKILTDIECDTSSSEASSGAQGELDKQLLSTPPDALSIDNTAVQEADLQESVLQPESFNLTDNEWQQHQQAFLSWHDNGRPQWAQERFDTLIFTIGGLKLAVPLIALGKIHRVGEGVTPIFGQHDWFIGLLNSSMGKIRVVDTAMFVMPERYRPEMAEDFEYVLGLDGYNWGLAVQSISSPIQLLPDEVNWRTERTKRPWLAGTVKEQMCALIDVPQMAKMLSSYEK